MSVNTFRHSRLKQSHGMKSSSWIAKIQILKAFFSPFIQFQRRPQHEKSCLRRRLHVLRLDDDWVAVHVPALCRSQLRSLLEGWCNRRSRLSIQHDWASSNRKSAGRIEPWNSAEKSQGKIESKERNYLIKGLIWWFQLQIKSQGRGELLISLCYQPAAARLTVVLLKARNLPRMDVTGLADPYVKIYLLYNVSESDKIQLR